MRIHSENQEIQPDRTNMNANTYTSDAIPYILWSRNDSSLCLINRQRGVRLELAALFAVDERTINRDIHRFWGEGFFRRILVFLIETSDPFP